MVNRSQMPSNGWMTAVPTTGFRLVVATTGFLLASATFSLAADPICQKADIRIVNSMRKMRSPTTQTLTKVAACLPNGLGSIANTFSSSTRATQTSKSP